MLRALETIALILVVGCASSAAPRRDASTDARTTRSRDATTPRDTGGVTDTGVRDTEVRDTGVGDSGVRDTSGRDIGVDTFVERDSGVDRDAGVDVDSSTGSSCPGDPPCNGDYCDETLGVCECSSGWAPPDCFETQSTVGPPCVEAGLEASCTPDPECFGRWDNNYGCPEGANEWCCVTVEFED